MCGITGFIDFNKNSSEEILQSMTDTLYHRGPDGNGKVMLRNEYAQVGLGHTRLSIIDLNDTGKQPMFYHHLTITFNGEIYNFKEIKKQLEQLGHQFKGSSDTEMILHAFEQWGVKCIDRFIGMFSFVIYDNIANEVYFFRDRTGIKPFFYYSKDNLLLFSSELKSFHKHPNFHKELDLTSISEFMQYGNVPNPYCIFKYCQKLKPGHYLSIQLSNKQITEKKYWDVYDYYNKPKLDISYNEAKIETEKLLISASEYRMVSDVPVGVFLSGGYDSSCITALLQKNRTQQLKTFTISIPEMGFDEAPDARKIATHLGTDHYEMQCTQKDVLSLIEDIPYYFDEPFADSSALPTTLVSKMAKEQVTVALSADGGDEIFAGYTRYDYLIKYGRKFKSIPSPLRSILYNTMRVLPSEYIPYLNKTKNFHIRYEKIKNILKETTDQNIVKSLIQLISDDNINKLFIDPVNPRKTAYSGEYINKNVYSTLSYQMAVDYQTYLVDDVLQKVDRATMTVSLEGREPLLDHRILEWAATLPDNFKYQNGIKKFILKDIVHDYIPKNIMDRPKKGFGVPISKWLRNDLKKYIDDYINEDIIIKQGVFSWKYVQKLKNDFFSGKDENDVELWYLLMFQMWYEKWM